MCDRGHEILVHFVRFFFVRDQGVHLSERPQADALAQLVQVGQMAHPPAIDRPQHDQPLQLPHDRRRHRGFALVVGGFGQADQVLGQIGRGQRAPLIRVFVFGQRQHLVHLGRQQIQVPFAAIQRAAALGGKEVHQPAQLVFHHAADRRAHAWLVHDLPALVVDDLALSVNDVVVLQDVFADVEVVPLDAHLRALDGFADQAVLDRHIFIQLHAIHDAGYALSAEPAHQIVFQRDEEARRARITLPARTAA